MTDDPHNPPGSKGERTLPLTSGRRAGKKRRRQDEELKKEKERNQQQGVFVFILTPTLHGYSWWIFVLVSQKRG